MKCDYELLEDYVENFLLPVQKQKVAQHVSQCANCRKTLNHLQTEQRLLTSALLKTSSSFKGMEESIVNVRKNAHAQSKRKRYQVIMITAALLFLSFTLLATIEKPNKNALPYETETQITATKINNEQIPLDVRPVLTFQIESEHVLDHQQKITYHIAYNEKMQRYVDQTFSKFSQAYDLTKIDLPYRFMHGLVSSNVLNEEQQVIASFDHQNPNAVFPTESLYTIEQDRYGNLLKYFTLPLSKAAKTFEILSYYVEIPTFSEQITMTNKANIHFEYVGHTYLIKEVQQSEKGLVLSIEVEGRPEIIPSAWYITVNGETKLNFTSSTQTNTDTILTIVLPEVMQMPDEIVLLPYLGVLEEIFVDPLHIPIP